MHLKIWAAVCHPDFSELFFSRYFHVLNFVYSSYEPSDSHVELIKEANTQHSITICRPSVIVYHFSSPEPKAHVEFIGWYSSRRASVRPATFTKFSPKPLDHILYENK